MAWFIPITTQTNIGIALAATSICVNQRIFSSSFSYCSGFRFVETDGILFLRIQCRSLLTLKSRSLLFNQRHSKTFQFSLHFETCEKKVGKILQILRPRKNTSNNNTENGHSSHTACWIYWLSATSVQPIFQKICVVSQVYIPQPSLWEYKSLGLKLFTF